VAAHAAWIEHLDRLALKDGAREQPRGHVRSSPGAVDGEEAQAGRGQPVEVAVRVRGELVRLLRRRVEADRVVDALVLAERQPVVRAVHRRRRRVGEVRDAGVPATFEHVTERDDIVAVVRARVDQRVAHARLRREMEHVRETAAREQRRGGLGFREIVAAQREGRIAGERGDARLLEPHVVVRIEAVNAGDARACRAQRACAVHADEPGRARDQHMHALGVDAHSCAPTLAAFAAALPPEGEQ